MFVSVGEKSRLRNVESADESVGDNSAIVKRLIYRLGAYEKRTSRFLSQHSSVRSRRAGYNGHQPTANLTSIFRNTAAE